MTLIKDKEKNYSLKKSTYSTMQSRNKLLNVLPTFKYVNDWNSIAKSFSKIDKVNNIFNSELINEISKIKIREDKILKNFNLKPIFSESLKEFYRTYEKAFNQQNWVLINSFKKYADLQNGLIQKANILGNDKVSNLQKFYETLAFEIFQYKEQICNFVALDSLKANRLLNDDGNIYEKVSQTISYAYRKDTTISPETLYQKSLVSDIHNEAKIIARKVIDINEKSKLAVNPENIFRPTNNIMTFLVELPEFIADNTEMFKKISDWLYKLIWENKKRIEKILDKKEFQFINNLRTYFFHDIEHDDEKDWKKKVQAIGDYFEKCIDKRVPETAKDWQKIQLETYKKVVEVLNKIEERIA